MYRYYFRFKKDDKNTRWLYNDKTGEWKKAKPSTYSERFFYSFVWSFLAFLFFLFMFVTVVRYAPFPGLLMALKIGDSMLAALWMLYYVLMILVAFFVKKTFHSFALYFIATTTVFFVSDVLMRDYTTEFYLYFFYGFIIAALCLVIVNIIKVMFSRSPRVHHVRNKDKHLTDI